MHNIQENVWASFRILHRSFTPGALSLCFPCCHSNRCQFQSHMPCWPTASYNPRHSPTHTQAHTPKPACPVDQLFSRNSLEVAAYIHQNFITMFLLSMFNFVLILFLHRENTVCIIHSCHVLPHICKIKVRQGLCKQETEQRCKLSGLNWLIDIGLLFVCVCSCGQSG